MRGVREEPSPQPSPGVPVEGEERGERRSGSWGSTMLIVNPFLGEVELHEREGEDDEEEDPGEGGGVAHSEELEGFAEEVVGVEEGGVDRAAAGHDEGFVEDLHGADHADDEVEENIRREHGDCDVAEAFPRAGAV